jgi:hypothetical protein
LAGGGAGGATLPVENAAAKKENMLKHVDGRQGRTIIIYHPIAS